MHFNLEPTRLRQIERRLQFQSAFRSMPIFETWDTEHPTGCMSPENLQLMLKRGISVGNIPIGPETITKHHVKVIPRRVRRSMARDSVRNNRQPIPVNTNPETMYVTPTRLGGW